jgi:hypothetical protein
VAESGDLLARFAGALARNAQAAASLGERLCIAYRDLSGATGAAVTAWYGEPHRVTLGVTDDTSARLEDLQDVVGEGPGHAAWASGEIEVGMVPGEPATRWSLFTEAAEDVVDSAVIRAVPMRPRATPFGVLTLYWVPRPAPEPQLAPEQLQLLADAVGAALIRDTASANDAADVDVTGAWSSRAQIHQATGMVVAQLQISPEDALALLRAHAYAQQSSLPSVAVSVVERRLNFSVS